MAPEPIPDGTLGVLKDGAVATRDVRSWCQGRKVVLIGVPGAFTPTCTQEHLPGYVQALPAFLAKGVAAIGCMAVNDVFVLKAWGDHVQAAGKIELFSDIDLSFTHALGLPLDLTAGGLGMRCQRFALVVDDAMVVHRCVESKPILSVSSAAAVLELL